MTDTDTTDRATATLDAYLASWNETDPARRAGLVEAAWAPDGRHVDPLADVTGHAGLVELAAGVQAQFPDHELRRTSGIDAHHDQLRFAWELRARDGRVVVAATDIAELAPDGRLARVAAFFGELA